jgi:hypothetical protein
MTIGRNRRLSAAFAAIEDSYRSGRPIVLTARNSGMDGRLPRRLAVNDLLELADALAKYGIDIRPDLPSATELSEMLRTAAPVKSRTRRGKEFTNRFASIDLRAKHGVYVVLSVGTGKALDDNAVQPFVNYLATVAAEIEPCLVFARRLDRITRRAWALGPLMLNLTEIGGYIGDVDYGLSRADGVESVLVFFRAQSSEDEATKLPTRSRTGMRRQTGISMASGWCPYAVPHPTPPGFFTYRRLEGGSIGPRIVTFDTPACLPSVEQVAAGLPGVFAPDENGAPQPVDQVANVRWVLERLGSPEWSETRIARGLAARSFSTDGLRRTNGPGATYSADTALSAAYRVLLSLKANLDLYETGVMHLQLGIAGQQEITITDCFPPDGKGWASPRDFARIRAWMLDHLRPAPRVSTLSGLPVLVNGVPCVVITRTGQGHRSFAAVKADDYRSGGRQRSPGVPIVLQPADIIEPFVDAIASAGDRAFPLLADTSDNSDALLLAELATARTRVRMLADQSNAIQHQVLQRSPDGALLITGTLLERLSSDYSKVVDTDMPAAQAVVDQLEHEITSNRQRAMTERAGIAADRLIHLIAGLRDDANTEHRELLHRSIQDLSITTTRHEHHRRAWWTLDITFTIRINTEDGFIEIPAHRNRQHGDVFDPDQIAIDVLDRLCAEPLRWADVHPSDDALIRRHVARHLGIRGRNLMLPNVDDPRLAHLVARLLRNPEDLPAIAHDSGESETLLQRILEIHSNAPRSVWRLKPQPTTAVWYRLGWTGPVTEERLTSATTVGWESARSLFYGATGRQHWQHKEGGYHLNPCPNCGSRKRVPAGIPEPAGLVCLGCETDEAGERWPLADYSKHLVLETDPTDGTQPK